MHINQSVLVLVVQALVFPQSMMLLQKEIYWFNQKHAKHSKLVPQASPFISNPPN